MVWSVEIFDVDGAAGEMFRATFKTDTPPAIGDYVGVEDERGSPEEFVVTERSISYNKKSILCAVEFVGKHRKGRKKFTLA